MSNITEQIQSLKTYLRTEIKYIRKMFKDTLFEDMIDFNIISGTFQIPNGSPYFNSMSFKNFDLFIFTKSGKDFNIDVPFKSEQQSMFMSVPIFGICKQIYAQSEGYIPKYSTGVVINSIQQSISAKQEHKKDFILFKYRPFTVNQWVYEVEKDVLSIYSDCLDSLKSGTIELTDAYKHVYNMMPEVQQEKFEKYVRSTLKLYGGNSFMKPTGELDKLLRKK